MDDSAPRTIYATLNEQAQLMIEDPLGLPVWVLTVRIIAELGVSFFTLIALTITIVLQLRTKRIITDVHQVAVTVEKATNGMRDDLVTAAGLAGETRGREQSAATALDVIATVAAAATPKN